MRTRMSLLFVALVALVACSRDKPATPAAPPASTAAATPAPAATATAAAAPAPVKESVFSRGELDQMVAPLALYPDPLLAQVLMAATYPGDVADAAAWSKAHPDAQGDDAVRQVAGEPWDPSVQSLVAFPQALAVLGQDPGWVQRLGDAFLAQPDDVMDAVQRLRRQAQQAGNLESNQYQKVSEVAPPPAAAPADMAPATGGMTTTETVASSPVIVIEPSDPQTVYVPSYNPTQVYGTWAYPSYPPPYYPPPSAYYPVGTALASGLAFGVGLAVTDALWGDFNWGGDDIDINVNRYNSINTNRQINASNSTWQHNSLNRDGVPYRDNYNREMNGHRLDGAANRQAFRGDDAQRAQAREQARTSMQSRGLQPARDNQQARAGARDAVERATPEQRERAQAAQRDRQQPQSRDAQRERAQAAQRDRTQAAQRDRAQAQHRAQGQHQQRARQSQSNAQARGAAQRQAHANRAPSNNAFHGAGGRPQAQHAAAQRGNASAAAARRPPQQRQAQGQQVNRQPSRSGGHQASAGRASAGGGRRR